MYPIWVDINKKNQVKIGQNDNIKNQIDFQNGYVDDNGKLKTV